MRFKVIVVLSIVFLFFTATAYPGESASANSEVSGFYLQGRQAWEFLKIDDLDSIVDASGLRLMPLVRLLRALRIETEKTDAMLSFFTVNHTQIQLDISRKEIQIGNDKKAVELFVGISDITFEKEIYLPADVVAEILLMKIEWDEQSYQFIARTDQKLSIWDKAPGASALSIQTSEVESKLPEMLGPGKPPNFSLDFMEYQLRTILHVTEAQSKSSIRTTLDSPKETLWGNAFGGRYKIQFAQPYQAWNTDTGYEKQASSSFMVSSASWTFTLPGAQIAGGDSTFGLNDLTFPIVRLAGVRINGLRGVPREERQWPVSPGIANSFITPEVFKGSAPAGSKVELLINDRSVEKQDVSVGTYEFEEVRLTPGALNTVRIIITEPGGFQRVMERNILGSSVNLPKGGMAYLGGIGTNRQIENWSPHGYLGGGRILYGLTNSLTLGTTWAGQKEFYLRENAESPLPDERGRPETSLHMGGQAAWVPWSHLFLNGDVSMSRGTGFRGSFNGLAYKFRGDFYPTRKIQIQTQFFHYDPGFFNGENRKLADREGYAVNARWALNKKWTLSSTATSVWNNTDHTLASTLYADFQNLEVISKAIPKSTIAIAIDRLVPSWEQAGAKMLYTLNIQASPSAKVYFDGFFSKGKYLDPSKEPEFFSGLRIPGFSAYTPPDISATLRLSIMPNTAIGAALFQSSERKRGTFLHTYKSAGRRVQVVTEAGYDLLYHKPLLISRADINLDRGGRNRIGIDTRYEQGRLSAFLSLNMLALYSHDRDMNILVRNSSVTPDRAGVHGRVFIDVNGNGILDPGEPGLEGIRVTQDNVGKSITDRNGYYVISAMGKNKMCRMALDMNTVPAIYSPTHALQTAYLAPSGLTEINLGVAPLHSISGVIHIITFDNAHKLLQGIHVQLNSTLNGSVVADSVTSKDGSYYFGDVRPGKYSVVLDPETLPKRYLFDSQKQLIEVEPKREPQELRMQDFEGHESKAQQL